MDEWDLLDEVDVIALWPNEHKKNVQSSKWLERKEALEVLSQLIEKHPRLSTSSMTIYGETMDELKKIVARDSNINVVIAALHVLKNLAFGLRKCFACFIPMIWPVILDKAKDKKSTVRDALAEALDAVSATCDANRLSKDLCEHLSKPSPQSKQCLCSFLYRYFIRQETLPIDFAKAVLPIVVKLTTDSDPTVRDAACSSLGSAQRLLGNGLDAFLGSLRGEKAKMEKIEEYREAAIKENAEFAASRPKRAMIENAAGGDVDSDAATSASVSNAPQDVDPWTLMDPTDVVAQMKKDFYDLAASKKWQERKEAIEGLLSVMGNAPRVAMSPDVQQVIVTLTKMLEKDVNINVSSLCAKGLTKFATAMRTDFATMVPKVMPIAFDKLKEKKPILRDELISLVDAASYTTPLECYTEAVCGGLTKPNPQSRAQTVQFTSRLLSRHSSSTFPVDAVKQLIPDLLKCCSDADADVRESAFRAMGAILRCVGEPAARRLFGELSEDKIKMGKILEYSESIRKEFGDGPSAEILRLHGSEPKKSKPAAVTSVPGKPSEAAPARKTQPGVGRSQPASATVPRPPRVASSITNRVSTAPKPNVVKGPSQQPAVRTAGQGRTPLTVRPVQPSVSHKSNAPVKTAAAPSAPQQRPRTPLAPNVVRSNQSSASKPVTNGIHGDQKPTSNALPRPRSGIRPPTALPRIGGTGIPRLSRPSSPSK
ncbi:unnamed protein product [Cylicocyclus nassatus]|uniref:TOG domain-containing protein n=1 Tax=Cylicocyclus nassatus TaxID=53992 RepID=A0AA36H7V3_CYLNA|nr:unnamed protein product [Cylicocyclus nassatus]